MNICLINPSLFSSSKLSPNIGDHIISRASHRELKKIFGNDVKISEIPSHSFLDLNSIKLLKKSELTIVGGSNLLWFRLFPPASWPIGPIELLTYSDLILMGVGWGAYNIKAGTYSKFIANKVLSSRYMHSLRDGYTTEICKEKLGLSNGINTGCHTTWHLAETKIGYSKNKSDKCIFSLTDYDKSPKEDLELIKQLSLLYKGNIILWPQGADDLSYAKSLGYNGEYIEPNLESYIRFLENTYSVDYVGTRLHAGILALEYGLNTLVIAIDNRAIEISKDINLPIIERNNISSLKNLILNGFEINLNFNQDAISSWKNQF
ncbi:polysaccharide pyruvyl transferase family protein [Malaciobacter mytili]|uniref:polysaccharide pyruvyl transferase family protein n=1 Tax=Malaciobacter mytili TaxID=603050 RepID=UPI003BAE46C5